MARVLSTATVLVLLAASAAAFALTEGAKLERSPIAGTRVDPIFSPEGRAKPVAHISFRVRKHERIRVWVQNAHGDDVRELQAPRTVAAGTRVSLVWNGLSDNGIIEPDGLYEPVVKLFRSHRTIVLPSTMRLDTKPPSISVRHPIYPLLSPDGDGHHDNFRVKYTVSEPAHAILRVRGRNVVFTNGQKLTGELFWNGRIKKKPPLPGRYLMTVAAQDRAGNVSKGVPFAIAQIRYVVLARQRVVVKPGAKFALRVSTDHPTITWRLNGRSGEQKRGTLHFRAPRSVGVYRLFVEAAGHAAKCVVVVA